MNHSASAPNTSVGDHLHLDSKLQVFNHMSDSSARATPVQRFQSSNQNNDPLVHPDPVSHRMQCCVCHAFHSSSHDLHRHYVESHSPHELSSALMQQQCLPSIQGISMTHVEKEDHLSLSVKGNAFERSRHLWSGLGDDTAPSFPEPNIPGLFTREENVFIGQANPCGLPAVHGRDIVGLPLVEAALSPSPDFDATLPQCTGSLEGLVKRPQKPTPQKIMSQMMGIAGEDGDDNWPDLGDDITLIDDENLLSRLDLFPNLLDFVIELDAKEESGALTIQNADLLHCPEQQLQYPNQHASCQAVGLLHYSGLSPEKRIDALQSKPVDECGSLSCTFWSNDYPEAIPSSGSLTHPLIPSHKHFQPFLGAKIMSVESTFENSSPQGLSNNALHEDVVGEQGSYKLLSSNDVSCPVMDNRDISIPTVSTLGSSSQHDASIVHSSLANQTDHHDAPMQYLDRPPDGYPTIISNQRDEPLICTDTIPPTLLVNCNATAANNIMSENNVVNRESFVINGTVPAYVTELSSTAGAHDGLHSGMTVSYSTENKISDCANPCAMSEKQLPSSSEVVPFDGGQGLYRIAPRFVTTQAPTRKPHLEVSVVRRDHVPLCQYDTTGLTHCSVLTSISSGASVPSVSKTLKSDHSASEIISSLTSTVAKPQLSNFVRNAKHRRSHAHKARVKYQLEENPPNLKSSSVSLSCPVTSVKTKLVKTSSGRIVKCKRSDQFIYEKTELDAISDNRLGVSSKLATRKNNHTSHVKLTKSMMGTMEIRKTMSHSSSELTGKSSNKQLTSAATVRLPVYTDPCNDIEHTPQLIDKDGSNTTASQFLSLKPFFSMAKFDSDKSKDERRQQLLCHLCFNQFPTLTILTGHLKTDHAEWLTCFACRCGTTFASEEAFRTHWRLKHRDFLQVTYTCRVCHQTFERENAFNAHLRVIHPDYKLICHVCEKRFVCMKSLRVHLAVHTKKQIFACPYCPKTYFLRYSFNRHFINHFSNLCCRLCNKRFKTKQSYDSHMSRHRTSTSLGRASTLKCNHCGDLSDRSSISSKEDPYSGQHKACASCNKGLYKMFSLTNESLALPNQVAEDYTPGPKSLRKIRQKCPQCQSSVLDLPKHVLRVHRQPIVPCDVCGALVKKECLPAHKDRAHATQGGIPCGHCDKVYANALSLREHMNRVNKKIKSVLADVI